MKAVASQTSLVPDRHRAHSLRVLDVVVETPAAVSLVLGVPAELKDIYTYRAGQFVTVKADSGGEAIFRSYSMSSAPGADRDLVITAKRVAGGFVSNWLNDSVRAGDRLEVSPPAGSFVLGEGSADIVGFAAGSGITPIFSIIKSALASTDRHVSLLYANRDEPSTIFKQALDRLVDDHSDRLQVDYHYDVDRGFFDGAAVNRFIGPHMHSEFFICGPERFMDMVDATLMLSSIRRSQVHMERFTPAEQEPPPGDVEDIEVVVTLGGKTITAAHRSKSTILLTARWAGLRPPSSCEGGDCATCMGRVVEGQVQMRRNEVLTPEEVAEGWILTCQAVPVTPHVKVVYE